MNNVLHWLRLALLLYFTSWLASSAELIVPGAANPWLAGMPNGSASDGDLAPTQSPIPVVTIPVVPGDILSFTVTGAVGYEPGQSGITPDGGNIGSHRAGADNGISNYTGPSQALIGVFLGARQPSLSEAPAMLNFSTATSRDFISLSPLLKQVFFIGDGKTSSDVVQAFVVPAGATRFYLGGSDGWGWANNVGSFSVRLSRVTASQPDGISIGFYAGLSISGTIGATYRIDFSGDMTSWTPLASVTLSASPELFYDPSRVGSRLFYRLIPVNP